jgi:hypothetical protein
VLTRFKLGAQGTLPDAKDGYSKIGHGLKLSPLSVNHHGKSMPWTSTDQQLWTSINVNRHPIVKAARSCCIFPSEVRHHCFSCNYAQCYSDGMVVACCSNMHSTVVQHGGPQLGLSGKTLNGHPALGRDDRRHDRLEREYKVQRVTLMALRENIPSAVCAL